MNDSNCIALDIRLGFSCFDIPFTCRDPSKHERLNLANKPQHTLYNLRKAEDDVKFCANYYEVNEVNTL